MKSNHAMRRLLSQLERPLRDLRDRDDQEYLVEAGWTRSSGAVLLKELSSAGGGSVSEYDVNDVAIRPAMDEALTAETRAAVCLETGLSFASRAVRAAQGLHEFESMVVMVSVSVDFDDEDFDEQPATVRFFGESRGPAWLNDLDRYQLEAIGLWSFPDFLSAEFPL